MLDPTANQQFEIQQEQMQDLDGYPPYDEPLQVLVANMVDKVPIKHCCGVMIPENDTPSFIEPATSEKTDHFDAVLQGGNFRIEIPNATFHAEVIVAKLLKVEPEKRLPLLAQIMRENGITRILLLTPAQSPMIQESTPWENNGRD